MRYWLLALPIAAAGGLLLATFTRRAQFDALRPHWRTLRLEPETTRFDPEMVAELPDPARRYLLHAIAPGTPLARSVEFSMHGAIRLEDDAGPLPMQARQVLAPPHGFIWEAEVGEGLMQIHGFDRYVDGRGAMRWWLQDLVPVVRADGPNVTRSAAGRLAGEAVMLPSALLPRRGVRWEAIDEQRARFILTVGEEQVESVITVDADGRLERAEVRRWNGDPANGPVGYQPFVVDQMASEATFDGYTVPAHFRAGWRLGGADEKPFFYATIETASYR